jgi:hypothetical protein
VNTSEEEDRNAYRNGYGIWVFPQIRQQAGRAASLAQILERQQNDATLQEAIRLEPEIANLLERAAKERCELGYHCRIFHTRYKPVFYRLVGLGARNEALHTSRHYDAVHFAIDSLLPLDEMELYPQGEMPNGEDAPSIQESREGRYYPDQW